MCEEFIKLTFKSNETSMKSNKERVIKLGRALGLNIRKDLKHIDSEFLKHREQISRAFWKIIIESNGIKVKNDQKK